MSHSTHEVIIRTDSETILKLLLGIGELSFDLEGQQIHLTYLSNPTPQYTENSTGKVMFEVYGKSSNKSTIYVDGWATATYNTNDLSGFELSITLRLHNGID